MKKKIWNQAGIRTQEYLATWTSGRGAEDKQQYCA